jgi:hypothetical protein
MYPQYLHLQSKSYLNPIIIQYPRQTTSLGFIWITTGRTSSARSHSPGFTHFGHWSRITWQAHERRNPSNAMQGPAAPPDKYESIYMSSKFHRQRLAQTSHVEIYTPHLITPYAPPCRHFMALDRASLKLKVNNRFWIFNLQCVSDS